ncbi:MAG: glycosyltransferase [Porphyrobacter sp.]|nr:glycosyltransferase [Porphyrobacter sp.]
MIPAAGPDIPLVSLLMVVRNGAAHIDAALASARRQTLRAIEIVVVDDKSEDATPEIIRRHAAEDSRIVPVPGHGRGLSAVRNLAMTAAAAPFAAVLDSDDILHPRHAEYLLELAERTGADIAAANMLSFTGDAPPQLFAPGEAWAGQRLIDRETFVRAGRLGGSEISLGYLKPLFRLDPLRRHGLGYDPRIRIGEDWDLVERALAAGLTYAYRPEPTYFYRRHPGSVSFRWREEDLAALIAAERDRPAAAKGSALAAAQHARLASLEAERAHCRAVEAIKARHFARAAAELVRRPAALRLLARSLSEGLKRRTARFAAGARDVEGAAASHPVALLCGTPEAGSPVALAAALLAASGCAVRSLSRAELADPLAAARAGHGAALVLLASEDLADSAAYVIGEHATFVGPPGSRHPRIERVIDERSFADLLALVPLAALADVGLAHHEARGLAPGIAA